MNDGDEERNGWKSSSSSSHGMGISRTDSISPAAEKCWTVYQSENWHGDPEEFRRIQLHRQQTLLKDLQRVLRGKSTAVVVRVAGAGEETVTLAVNLPLNVAARNRNVADARFKAISDANYLRRIQASGARSLRRSAHYVRRTQDRVNLMQGS